MQIALEDSFLLLLVLRRYAVPLPSGGVAPGPSEEGRRLARECVMARHSGKLLTLACDAWEIPIPDLARRSGVPEVELSGYVFSGLGLDPKSSLQIREKLEEIVKQKESEA